MRIFADNHIFNLSKENYESLECKIDKDNEYDEIFYIVAIHEEDKSFDLVVTTLSKTVATALSIAINRAWKDGASYFDIKQWSNIHMSMSYSTILQLYF